MPPAADISPGEGDTTGNVTVPVVPPGITATIDECQVFLDYLDATILLPIQRCLMEGIACIEQCDDTVHYSLREAILTAEARRQKIDAKCQEAVNVKLAQLYAAVIPMGYQVPPTSELMPPQTQELPPYAPPQLGQEIEVVPLSPGVTPSETEIPSAFLPWPGYPKVETPPPRQPTPQPVERQPQPRQPTPPRPPGPGPQITKQGEYILPGGQVLPPTGGPPRPPAQEQPPQPQQPGQSQPPGQPQQQQPTAPPQQPDLGPMGNLLFNPERPDEDSRLGQWFGNQMLDIVDSQSFNAVTSLRDSRQYDGAEPKMPFDIIPSEAK